MTPEDLSRASDDELYALEQQRTLEPGAWARIAEELQRRRRSRRAALADVSTPVADAPTLGDIERIAAGLEAALDSHFADVEVRLRQLRWWVFAVPLVWAILSAAIWLALREWAPEVLNGIVGPR